MKVTVNGSPHSIASATLAAALDELGYGGTRVATALNGAFVPATARDRPLAEGDQIEILAPRQGG